MCTLTVTNIGNATLESVAVDGQPLACSTAAPLAPAAALNCTVATAVNQAAFNLWDEQQSPVPFQVSVQATPVAGSSPAVVQESVGAVVALQSRQKVVIPGHTAAPSTVIGAGEFWGLDIP